MPIQCVPNFSIYSKKSHMPRLFDSLPLIIYLLMYITGPEKVKKSSGQKTRDIK